MPFIPNSNRRSLEYLMIQLPVGGGAISWWVTCRIAIVFRPSFLNRFHSVLPCSEFQWPSFCFPKMWPNTIVFFK